jgi:hypothetical protein
MIGSFYIVPIEYRSIGTQQPGQFNFRTDSALNPKLIIQTVNVFKLLKLFCKIVVLVMIFYRKIMF